jgi:hypothetical protein
VREIPDMSIVTADDYKRIRIPDAKPGQSFAYESGPEGIRLVPIKKAEPRRIQGKLVRKNGKLMLQVPEGLEPAPGAIPREVPR